MPVFDLTGARCAPVKSNTVGIGFLKLTDEIIPN